uniref:(northern house mosquito) hypothetical protein n=1 Tax=Culex pipiens TaxID=7175 RepID=A0A8D7ZVR2_CULPI
MTTIPSCRPGRQSDRTRNVDEQNDGAAGRGQKTNDNGFGQPGQLGKPQRQHLVHQRSARNSIGCCGNDSLRRRKPRTTRRSASRRSSIGSVRPSGLVRVQRTFSLRCKTIAKSYSIAAATVKL